MPGTLPEAQYFRVKGGDNVKTIIKLLQVLTELIRAISDLVREFKR